MTDITLTAAPEDVPTLLVDCARLMRITAFRNPTPYPAKQGWSTTNAAQSATGFNQLNRP
ncbi:hypothetical protein KEF85_03955 [Methylomonas paludis]|uniref:Uncharacterized protein n=1 Tax=Methylomonas paludis TaxID=1173101 RepID=A0A975RAS3_9GAMM|nr:hypothetical protein [Methylomonas paludis]QWF71643.1 hypothetical protein KEF85_03955 [Methylomonas paludis]